MPQSFFPSPPRLSQVLARQAGIRPQAIALHFEGRDIAYGELLALAECAAARLSHEWGIHAGDRVAWLGLNHPCQIVLMFALARLGAMLVPLNFRLAPAEWQTLLAGCTPSLLMHGEGWADAARELGERCAVAVHSADMLEAEHDFPEAPAQGHADAPVLLVHTSGTTGQPRAALHTQANVVANMQAAALMQQLSPADRVLTVLPLFHVGGLCIQTLPALYAGAQVILHPRFSADAVLACIAQQRPSLTLLVPATMKALVEHPAWPAADLSCLRAVWAGSSQLPAPLVNAFLARGVALCNVYGATETGPFSIALPPAFATSHAGSCGWPAPGVEVRLGEMHGDAGELHVRGTNVVARYWPDVPACDSEGWFHTGDLAKRARDGSYRVVGRLKELIISGGENIHPAEIEALLGEHPAVAECAAFGVAHAEWGEAVAVAIVARPGMQCDEALLAGYLEGKLARFKMPCRWLWVDALPKTALGKVRRGELPPLL